MESTTRPSALLSSLDAFQHFQPQFTWNQEEVHIVGLNANHIPIETRMLFRGTVDFCLFHPRDVFRFVMEVNASSFILAHNHPSGDPSPSYPDILLTKKLRQAAEIFQVELIDHIVLTPATYVSLKDIGVFDKRLKNRISRI